MFDFRRDGEEYHGAWPWMSPAWPAGSILVWQANSIPGGRVIYADVPTSWITGYVRPDYADAPAASGGSSDHAEGRFIQWWVDTPTYR